MSRIEEIMQSVEERVDSAGGAENFETEYSDHTEYTDYADCILVS